MNNWMKFFAKHPIQTQMLTVPLGIVSVFHISFPVYYKIWESPGSGGTDGLVAMIYAGQTALILGSGLGVVGGLKLTWKGQRAYQLYKQQKQQKLIKDIKNLK